MAVIESFEGGDDDSQDKSKFWRIGDEAINISVNPLLEMWMAYRVHNILPAPGGWLDQPLNTMVRIGAIDLIARTWEDKKDSDFDWSEFTPDQTQLIAWAEKEFS